MFLEPQVGLMTRQYIPGLCFPSWFPVFVYCPLSLKERVFECDVDSRPINASTGSWTNVLGGSGIAGTKTHVLGNPCCSENKKDIYGKTQCSKRLHFPSYVSVSFIVIFLSFFRNRFGNISFFDSWPISALTRCWTNVFVGSEITGLKQMFLDTPVALKAKSIF